ncbi:MAG: NAD(P)-dependent glycerol-3-phosphate dehydrogenase [Oscillospiraceae bacterium]|nr:NAD(P)-dependent glycerol-3-phosphate dehydrogenase [Oscillospiraceae bacterium]
MAKIVVLGAGAFGLALANTCIDAGHDVTVWSAFAPELEELCTKHESSKLPGVKISEQICLSDDLHCLDDADVAIIGIPSSFVRSVAKQISPYLREKTVLVDTSKGIEAETFKRMSEVIGEECPHNPVVALTGPSHAEELSLGIPTTVAVACEDVQYAEYIQDIFTTSTFRLYVNTDVIGCELGGAMKNVIALACGISDGLGYGDNTKAALMTRGIHEITQLGLAMGAELDTFSGLTGIGDLIVTCTSVHSRNRRAGMLIGQGVSPEEAVRQVGTVEGYFCCRVAAELAKKMGACMPITAELYRILFEQGDVRESLHKLMGRPNRHECEHYTTLDELSGHHSAAGGDD